jgi:type IV pilus assembly protein PilB
MPPNAAPGSSSAPVDARRQRVAVGRSARLGEVLVAMGMLQQSELNRFLGRQEADGRRLGDLLVAEGRLTREQLSRALAQRMGVEYYNLADGVDSGVAHLLDEKTARRYSAIPVRLDPDGTLVVAMAEPHNVLALDDLRMMTRHEVRPVLAMPEEIAAALRQSSRVDDVVEDLGDEAGDDVAAGVSDLEDGVDQAPIVRFVNSVIVRAIDERASDIHFEPQAKHMVVRCRVDGVLRQTASVPSRLASGVVSRIKIMADLDIAERRLPQDGRISLSVGGRSTDLRVACLPTVHGEKVVIRVLDKGNVPLELTELGFTPEVLARYEDCYRKPYGAVLVTGPTGSGKSTTLYGTLNQVASPERNVITIEDPVEYRMAGINQTQVNTKAGLTFAAGLRSILRCDPDVVMIGEIRDRETAQIAVESALTGHLVLATLHTNDAAGALTRLSEMGVPPFLTCSAVVSVLAQRLARRLCQHCREKVTVSHETLLQASGVAELPAGLSDPVTIHRAVGCGRCRGSGYQGRLGVFEVLVMSEPIERLAAAGATAEEIRRQAHLEGMRTMREDGLAKVLDGLTTLEELARTVA